MQKITETITAVGYARYSTDMQTENSIEYQTAAINKYCNDNNINLLRMYTDEAFSGTNTDRPGFQQMIQAARTGLFQAVVIYDISRGSRNVADWFEFRQEMMRAGVQVISTTQPLGDSMDPNNFLLELLNVGMGQHMVLDIRKKSIDGKTAAAKHATFQGGYPPLGYDVVNQKYVINEREAKIVRMIFDMYANGKSYKDILEALKDERTKRGAAFSANSFKNLLRNERYIGVYTWNKETERVFRKWVGRKPNPNMVRIENAIPAIIDIKTWDKVQKRLSDPSRNACNKAKHDYLLSGLIVCADCGNKYVGYTSTNTKGYSTRYYSCGRKYRTRDCMPKNINANFIENFVIESVKNFLRTTDVESLADALLAERAKTKPDLSAEKKELAQINEKIKNGVQSILNGLAFPELKSEIEYLQRKKKELELTIEKESARTIHLPDRADLIAYLKETITISESYDIKTLIKKHVKKINAFNDGSFTVIVGVDMGSSPCWA